MKLKSPAPAASTVEEVSAHSPDTPFAQPARPPSRTPLAVAPANPIRPTAPADLFESFVRKLVAHIPAASLGADNTTNVINGCVVAQASIDGVRYVMVRCEPKPGEALLSLSPRERDIVNLIIKGYPNKMIADMLDISAWTVGTHLRRIFAKLGVTSRAAMVARYLHHLGD